MNKVFLSLVLGVITNAPGFSQDILKVTGGALLTVQKNASIYISGGIVLDDKSTFKNDGLVTIAATNNITANFTDNTVAAYTYGTGEFMFSGNAIQTVKTANQIQRIDVDNAGMNLASNIQSNIWFLKKGKVNTASFIAIATSTASTAVQSDVSNVNFASSWINGKLRRYVSPAVVNVYSFPVGDAAKANAAEMGNLVANPMTGITYITVAFGPKAGNDIGLNVAEPGASYNSVNPGGVWYITPDALPVSGKYDLKLFFSGFANLADNKFGILRRPDASQLASDWKIPVNSLLPAAGSAGRTIAGGYARRNGISTFNQFGIGITSIAPALQRSADYVSNNLQNNAGKLNSDVANKFNVYPNPVMGKAFFVDYSGGKVKNINLLTIDGRQIACTYSSSGEYQLRVTVPVLTAKGTYVLQLLTDERTLNTPIIIQ